MDYYLDDHDRGLAFDLSTLLQRRSVLGLIAGAGVATMLGCSRGADQASGGGSTTAATATGSAASTGACTQIPAETAGPFPGDGSNGPNVLTQSGIVRSDIRSSFGSASGVARGVPLTIKLTVQDRSKACAALSGAAIYVWHCDRDGRYSLYSSGTTDENYLRGMQQADGSGVITFTSIFPAAYSGRWPHVHFEVYRSLANATAGEAKLATSQLALPRAVCDAVYATDDYGTSARNLAQISLDSDNVFRDGYASQLATVTGSVSSGFVAALSIPV
jgi:protocatechuate 3,4-dioxygenase beta subunit